MSSRNSVLVLATSALLLGATSASAEPPGPDYSRPGFYVGVNGIYALNFFDDGGGLIDIRNTGGLNVRAGYRFQPWLAGEFLYEWGSNFKTTLSDPLVPPGMSLEADVTTHTITANLKLLWPRWRAQPYLLVGLGAQGVEATARSGGASVTESQWGFAVRPGVGVDFYITENIVLNAEVGTAIGVFGVDEPFPGTTEAEVYMSFGGGLQYRF